MPRGPLAAAGGGEPRAPRSGAERGRGGVRAPRRPACPSITLPKACCSRALTLHWLDAEGSRVNDSREEHTRKGVSSSPSPPPQQKKKITTRLGLIKSALGTRRALGWVKEQQVPGGEGRRFVPEFVAVGCWGEGSWLPAPAGEGGQALEMARGRNPRGPPADPVWGLKPGDPLLERSQTRRAPFLRRGFLSFRSQHL